jgi:hypothetical protein
MLKISVHTLKITFIAGVICSNALGFAFAQSPDDGIAPIGPRTDFTPPPEKPKEPHTWFGVPGTGTGSYNADRFYNTYYSDPASDAFESYGEFAARCGTRQLNSDDKLKILLECKNLPTPYNLVCAAQIVRKILDDGTDNVCRHHAVMMVEAAQTLGFKATFEAGWDGWAGHAWAEVEAYGKRYIIDSFGNEYYSMDGPLAPYCGNDTKEEGESCDGRDNPCGEGFTCESCECSPSDKNQKTVDATPTRNKTTGFSLIAEYAYIDTGALTKAGKASSESVDNLLGYSTDESGYGFSLGGRYRFAPKGTLGIIPRIDVAYQHIGGIHFSEDFQIDGSIRVNSERELTGHGVRFGVGADIPLGNTNSWSLGFTLGGTYMKNTVDQTRTATDNGIEIGSIDNSASTTTLNPYAEAKLMFEPGSFEKYQAMKRWAAGGGVRIEKSTLLDDIQGEFSDTNTSIFLEIQIPLGK